MGQLKRSPLCHKRKLAHEAPKSLTTQRSLLDCASNSVSWVDHSPKLLMKSTGPSFNETLRGNRVDRARFIARETFSSEEGPRGKRANDAAKHCPTSDQFEGDLHFRILRAQPKTPSAPAVRSTRAPSGKKIETTAKLRTRREIRIIGAILCQHLCCASLQIWRPMSRLGHKLK
jgi:hypothetical protein